MFSSCDSVSALQVTCHAVSAGAMSTVLEVCTQGSTTQQLAVTAAAMQPSMALSATHMDLGVCYVGVPTSVDVTMSNLTLLPTAFDWEGYGSGAQQLGRGQMSVTVHPGQGTLPPGIALSALAGITIPPDVPYWQARVMSCTTATYQKQLAVADEADLRLQLS